MKVQPQFGLLFLAAAAAVILVFVLPANARAQSVALDSLDSLEFHNAEGEVVNYKGQKALKMVGAGAPMSGPPPGAGRRGERPAAGAGRAGGGGPRFNPEAVKSGDMKRPFAILKDTKFQNGVIEVEVAGTPRPGSQGGARGFIGIAFRMQDRQTYECFYVRPTNGRAEDQERRNHSAQYISHPEYPWNRLRGETPSKYEAYVDLVPGEWTKLRIEVRGEKARLYVHGQEQPTLLVNDLKLGADASGPVALWMENSTQGYYRNLKISP